MKTTKRIGDIINKTDITNLEKAVRKISNILKTEGYPKEVINYYIQELVINELWYKD